MSYDKSVVSCGVLVVSEKPGFWDMLGTLYTFGSLEKI